MGPRWAPAIAYDRSHNQIVLFAGQRDNFPAADTWVWTNIVATAGNPQSTPSGGIFTVPLEVHVVDDTGHYTSRAEVSFSGPPEFVTVQNATVRTNTAGFARARVFAKSKAGAYLVTASLATGDFTTFVLSNTNTQMSTTPCVVSTQLDDLSPGSLRYHVAACGRGGTITFRPGLGSLTLAHGQDIQLTQDVTIGNPDPANAVTLDARAQSRHFFVSGGTVWLRYMALKNGLARGGNGGDAVYPGGGAAGMGGSVFVNTGTLISSYLEFRQNQAQGGTGGGTTNYDPLSDDIRWGGGGGIGHGVFGSSRGLLGLDKRISHGGGGGDLGGSGGFHPEVNGGPGAGSAMNGKSGFGGGGSGAGGLSGASEAGFGGGAGAGGSAGAFGGISDSYSSGGGAGLGGAIFVRAGNLLIEHGFFAFNQALGAPGGLPGTPALGQGKGGALFIAPQATAAWFNNSPAFGTDDSANFADTAGGGTLCDSRDTSDICGAFSQLNIQLSGSNQTAVVNQPFASPLSVRFTAANRPITALPVLFFGPSSGASIAPVRHTAPTDANGLAKVSVSANKNAGGPYLVRTALGGLVRFGVYSLTNAKGPDLTITKTHSSPFVRGKIGTYTIRVTNSGSSDTSGAPVTVTDVLPAGLRMRTMIGRGWASCWVGPDQGGCRRSDKLGPGQSFDDILVTVLINSDAPGSAVNTATVSGGGDTNPSNNTATDSVVIVPSN